MTITTLQHFATLHHTSPNYTYRHFTSSHLYMQFYGISFMRTYNQSGRWQDVLDQAYHKTACTSLPEEEHLEVPNM
jgi:hypothetical protein